MVYFRLFAKREFLVNQSFWVLSLSYSGELLCMFSFLSLLLLSATHRYFTLKVSSITLTKCYILAVFIHAEMFAVCLCEANACRFTVSQSRVHPVAIQVLRHTRCLAFFFCTRVVLLISGGYLSFVALDKVSFLYFLCFSVKFLLVSRFRFY